MYCCLGNLRCCLEHGARKPRVEQLMLRYFRNIALLLRVQRFRGLSPRTTIVSGIEACLVAVTIWHSCYRA